MKEIVRHYVLPATYRLLPSALESAEATHVLMAIGYQESRFTHRRQIGGPARGWWQFEQGGGVHGVLSHEHTKDVIADVWKKLGYLGVPTPYGCWTAIEHNDMLAAAFARLLLWTLPEPLPGREDESEAWRQYLKAWRPGKPHPEQWASAWRSGALAS